MSCPNGGPKTENVHDAANTSPVASQNLPLADSIEAKEKTKANKALLANKIEAVFLGKELPPSKHPLLLIQNFCFQNGYTGAKWLPFIGKQIAKSLSPMNKTQRGIEFLFEDVDFMRKRGTERRFSPKKLSSAEIQKNWLKKNRDLYFF